MDLVSFVILLIESVMISALPSFQTVSLKNLFFNFICFLFFVFLGELNVGLSFIYLKNFYWSIVALQCCMIFCCTEKWMHYLYLCVYTHMDTHISPLFWISFPFSHHRALSRVPCGIHWVLISCICYI